MPRKVIVVIGIILCLGVVSCNLFKTRTPDEPTEVSSNYVPPTDPEKVLQNMVDSFRDKNMVNYLKSLSNASFTFEAAKSHGTYGDVFSSWDKKAEGDYFDRVKNRLQQNSYVTLTFGTLTTTYFIDSAQVETDYQLIVPHTEANISKNFRGRAQFLCVRDQSGDWSIRQWLDINVGVSDSTWSDLKGIAYTQWL